MSKDEKSFSARLSSFRPENRHFFRVKPNLIHWISDEPHGKSERLEMDIEDLLKTSELFEIKFLAMFTSPLN